MTHITLSEDMQTAATRAVFAALEARGGKGCVRFVGGCVRNALMRRTVSDLDLSTQLLPDETEAALAAARIKSVPTGKAFGTITAIAGGEPFEITSLREDVETDGRRAVVKFTDDWAKDAQRRDFYLNALYADIDGKVYDPTGCGVADAQEGRVRFIGEADQRIREDYLRILRFFRFTAGYAVVIDEVSLAACERLRGGIDGLSGERVQQELLKTFAVTDPVPVFRIMLARDILSHVLPGLRFPSPVLPVLAAMTAKSDDPERRLMALLSEANALGLDALRALQVRLRWSVRLLVRLRQAGEAMDRLAAGEGLHKLIYLYDREAVIDALHLASARTGEAVDAALADAQAFRIRMFPLKGSDLIARGMTAGPELGTHLKQIETDWVNHDFSQSVIDRALDALAKRPT